MDRLTSMEVFVTVVESGSFTAASEVFGITPVMVGKHIRALEEHLGATLLTRTTRRQSLTEAGARYYERSRQILQDIRDAEAGIEALQGNPRGLLRINAPLTFGAQRLVPVITDYLNAHHDVSVELVLDDRVVDLVKEGFDAAIRIGTLEDSGLIARPLQPYRMVMAASPEYLAAHGTPKKPADLDAHECLSLLRGGRLSGWRLNTEVPALSSRFRSNNGQALRMAALQGGGIIVQPEALLQDDLKSGRLKPLMPKYLPEPRPVHLVYPKGYTTTPKLKAFVDFVIKRFGKA